MASPSPVPPSWRERAVSTRKKRSVRRGRCSGAMPGPVVGDDDAHGRPAREQARRDRRRGDPLAGDLDLAALAAVLDRVVDQVADQLDQLIAIADHLGQLRILPQAQRDAPLCGIGAQGLHDPLEAGRGIDPALRRLVLGLLDPRQREQVVDQPRHAGGLVRHDLEKALARLVRRRAPARTGSRCSPPRTASGVRSSWLALATKSERICSIMSCSVSSRSAISAAGCPRSRTGMTWTPKARRGGPSSCRASSVLPRPLLRLIDGREQAGIAQLGLERLVARIGAEQRDRRPVDVDHDAPAGHQEHGIGQRVQEGRDQLVGLLLPRTALGQRTVEAVQRGGELVAAERPEIGQRLRLAAFGERCEVAMRRPQPALAHPGEPAAQRQHHQPGDQRRDQRPDDRARPGPPAPPSPAGPARWCGRSAGAWAWMRQRLAALSRAARAGRDTAPAPRGWPARRRS